MTGLQKAFSAVAGIALVTTLVLPKRQTAAVIKAIGDSLSNVFGTVMGTK